MFLLSIPAFGAGGPTKTRLESSVKKCEPHFLLFHFQAAQTGRWCNVAMVTVIEWGSVQAKGAHCDKKVTPETLYVHP